MSKITYENKEQLNTNENIPAKNKCMASDLNEIKSIVNENDTNALYKKNVKTSQTNSDTEVYSCNYINSTIIPVVKFSGDFNNYTENAVGSCDGLTINKPTTTAFYGTMIVLQYGKNYCSQFAIDINTGYMYSRVLLNSKWQTWKKITTTDVN